MSPALTALLLAVPLAGCLVVLGLPQRHALPFGAAVSGLTLLDALALGASFDYSAPARMQAELDWLWVPALGIRLHLGVDGVSLPLVVLTALLTALCHLYLLGSAWSGGGQPSRPRSLVALLLLLHVGMLGTFVALDLLVFFLFFELVLVPMYAVVSGWGGPGRGAAARQFILYTLLGSGLLLVGLLVIYAQTGTLDMVALMARGGLGMSATVQVLAFLAVAGGLAVKTPMWPLHSWLPDAHTEAPTVGSVLLAGVLLKMGTYGLIRIAVPMLPAGAAAVAPFIGAFGVVGVVYAALACLAQRDLKRLVAFSSVGHMGFVLLGIATLTPVGMNAALFGNIAHGLVTGLLFFLAGGVKERYGTTHMTELGGGLLAKAPYLGSLLTFAALAGLGLPGLAGFWGEMLALLAAFEPAPVLAGGLYLTFMAVAGIGAVLTAAYFLVMLRRVTHGAVLPAWRAIAFPDLTGYELAAWTPLAVGVLVVGLWPRTVLGITDPAVRGLLAATGGG